MDNAAIFSEDYLTSWKFSGNEEILIYNRCTAAVCDGAAGTGTALRLAGRHAYIDEGTGGGGPEALHKGYEREHQAGFRDLRRRYHQLRFGRGTGLREGTARRIGDALLCRCGQPRRNLVRERLQQRGEDLRLRTVRLQRRRMALPGMHERAEYENGPGPYPAQRPGLAGKT